MAPKFANPTPGVLNSPNPAEPSTRRGLRTSVLVGFAERPEEAPGWTEGDDDALALLLSAPLSLHNRIALVLIVSPFFHKPENPKSPLPQLNASQTDLPSQLRLKSSNHLLLLLKLQIPQTKIPPRSEYGTDKLAISSSLTCESRRTCDDLLSTTTLAGSTRSELNESLQLLGGRNIQTRKKNRLSPLSSMTIGSSSINLSPRDVTSLNKLDRYRARIAIFLVGTQICSCPVAPKIAHHACRPGAGRRPDDIVQETDIVDQNLTKQLFSAGHRPGDGSSSPHR